MKQLLNTLSHFAHPTPHLAGADFLRQSLTKLGVGAPLLYLALAHDLDWEALISARSATEDSADRSDQDTSVTNEPLAKMLLRRPSSHFDEVASPEKHSSQSGRELRH